MQVLMTRASTALLSNVFQTLPMFVSLREDIRLFAAAGAKTSSHSQLQSPAPILSVTLKPKDPARASMNIMKARVLWDVGIQRIPKTREIRRNPCILCYITLNLFDIMLYHIIYYLIFYSITDYKTCHILVCPIFYYIILHCIICIYIYIYIIREAACAGMIGCVSLSHCRSVKGS